MYDTSYKLLKFLATFNKSIFILLSLWAREDKGVIGGAIFSDFTS